MTLKAAWKQTLGRGGKTQLLLKTRKTTANMDCKLTKTWHPCPQILCCWQLCCDEGVDTVPDNNHKCHQTKSGSFLSYSQNNGFYNHFSAFSSSSALLHPLFHGTRRNHSTILASASRALTAAREAVATVARPCFPRLTHHGW